MMKNPNAVIGGGSGLGGGAAVVFLLALFGIHVDAYAGLAIGSAVTTAVLWVGRSGGLAGVWHRILHGSGPRPPTV